MRCSSSVSKIWKNYLFSGTTQADVNIRFDSAAHCTIAILYWPQSMGGSRRKSLFGFANCQKQLHSVANGPTLSLGRPSRRRRHRRRSSPSPPMLLLVRCCTALQPKQHDKDCCPVRERPHLLAHHYSLTPAQHSLNWPCANARVSHNRPIPPSGLDSSI